MTIGADVVALVSTHVGRGVVTGLVTVVGLLVGSFLNVVIYRVPRHLSVVEPRSFCPHCDTPVRSLDNIPVLSWVALGGRCRQCRGPIAVRYPLVELATGVVFASIGFGLGAHWAVGGFCALAATLIALVAIERDGPPLPLSVAGVGTGIAAALLLGAGLADRRWSHVVGLVVGVVVALALVVVKSPWTSSAPIVLPVGAAFGWLGPAPAAEGLATAVVVLAVARLTRTRTSASAPRPAVLGLALATGAVVATVVAVAVGAGVGR